MRAAPLPLVRQLWQDHRDRVALAGLGAAFLALFALTTALTAAYRAREEAVAEDWHERGLRALTAQDPEEAVADFRNALAWSRNNPAYQLRLAQALLASGRGDEARAYLLTLWQREPGHGLVNLELARLAARADRIDEAHRHYHDAIYGVWEADAPSWRRRARFELVELLLDRGRPMEALSELRPLSEDLPEEAASYEEVGRLFLRAGDPADALAQFRKALALEPQRTAALAGAAEAAFVLGRHPSVVQFGERALRRDRTREALAEMVEVSRRVLRLDPAGPRLASSARSARVRRLFDVASAELERCAAGRAGDAELEALLARAHDLRPRLRPSALQRDLDLREQALDLAFEAVRLTARACGEPSAPEARAALWIARRERAEG